MLSSGCNSPNITKPSKVTPPADNTWLSIEKRPLNTRPNCFKLQALKQASKQVAKQKVHVPKAQDPMVLIHELVKALNLYANTGADLKSSLLSLHLRECGCKRLNLSECV